MHKVQPPFLSGDIQFSTQVIDGDDDVSDDDGAPMVMLSMMLM